MAKLNKLKLLGIASVYLDSYENMDNMLYTGERKGTRSTISATERKKRTKKKKQAKKQRMRNNNG